MTEFERLVAETLATEFPGLGLSSPSPLAERVAAAIDVATGHAPARAFALAALRGLKGIEAMEFAINHPFIERTTVWRSDGETQQGVAPIPVVPAPTAPESCEGGGR